MTAKSFLNKIEAIANTAKITEKLATVCTFDAMDRRLARAALDPTVSYYMAKLPAVKCHGVDEFCEGDFAVLDQMATRQLSGKAASEWVEDRMSIMAPEDAEVLRRIILKDLRAGLGDSLLNKAFPGDVPSFSYMRCSLPKASNIDKWDWSAGVYCQLKADGSFARVAVDTGFRVLITTRQGNTYPDVPALAKLKEDALNCFNLGTETHGELTVWINGVLQPRTIGNGMLNSLQNGGDLPEGAEVQFDCWDQIPLHLAVPKGKVTTPYSRRYYDLMCQISDQGGDSTVKLIEGTIVHSKFEALSVYRSILARGLEGVILKDPNGIWADTTSKDCVKFKLEVDLDLKIVGFNAGTAGKRTAATFGSLRVQSEDGLLEADVAGFTREMETYLHENRDSVLGKILCVRANALAHPSESNEKYSLFHPRFVELRLDKVVPDTLDQVKAQFEAAIA